MRAKKENVQKNTRKNKNGSLFEEKTNKAVKVPNKRINDKQCRSSKYLF